jgi:hyaluronan synthase
MRQSQLRPFGQITTWIAFVGTLLLIMWLKAVTLDAVPAHLFFGVYSLVVTGYILSRFLLASLHPPPPDDLDEPQHLPKVTFIIPAKNEEAVIAKTLRHCLQADYPPELLQVIAVNDGSDDATLREMKQVQAEFSSLAVESLHPSQGKRHAQAAGIRQATGDILIFVDSDSLIEPDAVRRIVRYFRDPTVGAVSGHADVYNKSTNLLTIMQSVRYYIAFRVYKGAESLFGSVTCCSGCFSAYRRTALMPVFDKWLNQTFLGVPSTYGDDRSLTNFLLPDYRVLYARDAVCQTVVPDTWGQFLRQQLRWKRSWVRETLRAAGFMWRKHPVMAASFYTGAILPVLAPVVAFRALVYQPVLAGLSPYTYLAGVALMALLYGLYYRLHRRDNHWPYGVLFALVYAAVLVWQLPYAALTLHDNRWGTR